MTVGGTEQDVVPQSQIILDTDDQLTALDWGGTTWALITPWWLAYRTMQWNIGVIFTSLSELADTLFADIPLGATYQCNKAFPINYRQLVSLSPPSVVFGVWCIVLRPVCWKFCFTLAQQAHAQNWVSLFVCFVCLLTSLLLIPGNQLQVAGCTILSHCNTVTLQTNNNNKKKKKCIL